MAQLVFALLFPTDNKGQLKNHSKIDVYNVKTPKYLKSSIEQSMLEGLNRLFGIYDECLFIERNLIKFYTYMAAYVLFRKPAILIQVYD